MRYELQGQRVTGCGLRNRGFPLDISAGQELGLMVSVDFALLLESEVIIQS